MHQILWPQKAVLPLPQTRQLVCSFSQASQNWLRSPLEQAYLLRPVVPGLSAKNDVGIF